jgi:hypothetical protein
VACESLFQYENVQEETFLEEEKAMPISLDTIGWAQENDLLVFLDLMPWDSDTLGISDTLITFCEDRSFSGWIHAQYIQIYKTASSCQLTQTIYTNQIKKGEGFLLVNELVGMEIDEVYKDSTQQMQLSREQWDGFVRQLQEANFWSMGKEDCGRIVMDGTFYSLMVHSKHSTHRVEQHACPNEAFHQLTEALTQLGAIIF